MEILDTVPILALFQLRQFVEVGSEQAQTTYRCEGTNKRMNGTKRGFNRYRNWRQHMPSYFHRLYDMVCKGRTTSQLYRNSQGVSVPVLWVTVIFGFPYPWTGRTQLFQPPGTLETDGTQSFQPPPTGTLGTRSSKMTGTDESLTVSRGLVLLTTLCW